MELKVVFFRQGCADGIYKVRAAGCAAALLSWADRNGILKDWTAFAYVPLDSCGRGVFQFRGGRAIPLEATHIHVRAVKDHLLECKEELFSLPDGQQTHPIGRGIKLCVMSDLHLSLKADTVRKAFSDVKGADMLLLAGDLTNDGTKEEYLLLEECLKELESGTEIYPVAGNHDIPVCSSGEKEQSGIYNYAVFQERIFGRAGRTADIGEEKCAKKYIQGPDGAYAVQAGTIEIIGLQAVTDHRRFLFAEGRQLAWLDRHLGTARDIRQHMILCHAPLLHHNPKREAGRNNPYLNRDKQLQEMINRHGKTIFISGHTHVSMDYPAGCVEWDEEHRNLYINDGSVCPTDLLPGELMQPKEWRDGTRLDIVICDDEVEIMTYSVKSGKKHARGYYRIDFNVESP